jgi:hypothetical protein
MRGATSTRRGIREGLNADKMLRPTIEPEDLASPLLRRCGRYGDHGNRTRGRGTPCPTGASPERPPLSRACRRSTSRTADRCTSHASSRATTRLGGRRANGSYAAVYPDRRDA